MENEEVDSDSSSTTDQYTPATHSVKNLLYFKFSSPYRHIFLSASFYLASRMLHSEHLLCWCPVILPFFYH